MKNDGNQKRAYTFSQQYDIGDAEKKKKKQKKKMLKKLKNLLCQKAKSKNKSGFLSHERNSLKVLYHCMKKIKKVQS